MGRNRPAAAVDPATVVFRAKARISNETMSRRDWDPERLDRLPNELDGSKLVGIDDEGSMVYYDPLQETTLSASVHDAEELPGLEEVPSPTEIQPLEGESLASFIEEIEESTGWQALSEFAREKVSESD